MTIFLRLWLAPLTAWLASIVASFILLLISIIRILLFSIYALFFAHQVQSDATWVLIKGSYGITGSRVIAWIFRNKLTRSVTYSTDYAQARSGYVTRAPLLLYWYYNRSVYVGVCLSFLFQLWAIVQSIGPVIYSIFNKILLALLGFIYLVIIFIVSLLSSYLPPSNTRVAGRGLRSRRPTGSRSFHSSTRILKDPPQPDASIENFSLNSSNFQKFIEELPRSKEFNNLHITENLKKARSELKGLAGVYAIICKESHTIYIGSSMDLGNRMMDHIMESSNVHLRHAMNKYGVESFTFIVVEFVTKVPRPITGEEQGNLIAREQFYLDLLFTLPSYSRYNNLSVAGSSYGYKHTEEAKSKIGEAARGRVMSAEDRARMSEERAGENHPMFGKKHTEEAKAKISGALAGRTLSAETRELISASLSRTIYVFDSNTQELLATYSGQVAVCEDLHISIKTLRKYLESGVAYKGKRFSYTNTPI